MSEVGDIVADEMEAAVWTAIGLVAATSLGSLFYLGSRIDALGARMDTRFDRVDQRFDRMDDRLDRLSDKLSEHADDRTRHNPPPAA